MSRIHPPSSDAQPELAADEANVSQSPTPAAPEAESREHPILEIIRFSIIALIIVIPIRMFIAQPFIVSGASMETTFSNNQYLIVDQLSYQFDTPERGDVVIFRYPQDLSKFFIKRVIGVPGDTVTIDGDQVRVSNDANPDGIVLDEPYVQSMSSRSYSQEVLGPREYFVLGDNRDESSDSRVWGVLQEEHIIGRALLRLFPPSTADYLPGAYSLPLSTTTSSS